MARIRSIKPEFFISETVASLPLSTRLSFIGLWTHVDDNGVCVDNERLINAAIWPLEEDPLETLQRTREDLQRLSTAGLVTRYEHSGRRYLAVNSWDEHQKVSHPGKPRYPRPDDPGSTPFTSDDDPHTRLSGGSPEAVGSPPEILVPEQGAGSREQGAGKKTPPAPPVPPRGDASRGTRIPDDFAVDDDLRTWARDKAPLCGNEDHEAFCDYWRGIPGAKGRKADWPATWKNWMRRAQQDHAGTRRSGRAGDRLGPDDRLAAIQALKQDTGFDRPPTFSVIQGRLA